MAILDQFVVGKRRGQVFCEVIDTDINGVPPNNSAFDESSLSLLDVIVETGDKVLISVYVYKCLIYSIYT